mgnify:FL=1
MNERIRKLRKTLDLTQTIFAERIGLKQNSIALIESGKRNISDQAILSICREFNVNEEWLRFGIGEMFKPISHNAIDALVQQNSLTDSDRILIEKFIFLKPELRKIFADYILDAAKALQAQQPPTIKPVDQTAIGGELHEKCPKTAEELERRYPPLDNIDLKDA